jgi:hypothetical protein
MTEYKAPQGSFDKDKLPVPVKVALMYGLVKPDWNLAQYLRYAAETQGYELVLVTGAQGAGKSSLALQMLNWIYNDWQTTLDCLTFHPRAFVDLLKSIPKGERIPALVWDDLTVNFGSTKFKTDSQLYEQIDSTFAAIRVKASVIIATTPSLNRVPKVIRDHCSFEVFVGRNQTIIVERICHIPCFDKLENNLIKVLVEGPRKFNLYEVPKPVFQRYWSMRLDLTEDTLDMLGSVVPKESVEDMVTVWDAAKECSLGPSTIMQMGSKGVLPTVKIGNTLYMPKTFLPELQEHYPKKN